MIHKRKEITLINSQGKPVKFLTAEFNFEVDEYLKARFPKLDADEITIDLSDAEKDFSKLLIDEKGREFNDKIHKIDLKKQDYDLILSVYAFFLRYKKNAYLRQLQYNNETLAFEIEQAKKILTSMPEIISAIQKRQNMRDS